MSIDQLNSIPADINIELPIGNRTDNIIRPDYSNSGTFLSRPTHDAPPLFRPYNTPNSNSKTDIDKQNFLPSSSEKISRTMQRGYRRTQSLSKPRNLPSKSPHLPRDNEGKPDSVINRHSENESNQRTEIRSARESKNRNTGLL